MRRPVHGRSTWALGAILGSTLLIAACSSHDDSPPDIVLISIDTIRADHLGCTGHALARTPNIDRLATEGVLYEQCQTPVPITLPAHTTMLTGLLPPRHGVRNNATYRLGENVPTLAGKLDEVGYKSGAFVGALPLARRFGLDRGFDVYDDGLPDRAASDFAFRERPATEVVAAALAWLDEQPPDRPVFLFVHFFEPHIPYDPPTPFAEPFRDHPYDGEIAAADAAVGLLLAGFSSRREAQPLTVLTGDHGEGLGQHDEKTHALFLYQTTLHVPLILHAPDRWPAGRRISRPVTLCDLAPTLLAAAGVAATGRLESDGIVLDPAGDEPPLRPLYAETLYPLENFSLSPAFALRSGREKVIRSRRPLAFDLGLDPGETRNLAAGKEDALPDRIGHLLRRTDAALADLTARAVATAPRRTPASREQEALRSLGYLGGTSHAATAHAADSLLAAVRRRPETRDRLDEIEISGQADELIAAGRPEEAVTLLENLLTRSPDNAWARIQLAQTQLDLGRLEEALASYERANGLRPGWLEIQLSLGRLYDRTGQSAQAVESYRRALQLAPHDVTVRLEAAGIRQRSGDIEGARRLLEEGLERSETTDAERARLRWALALSLFYTRDFQASRAQLDRLRGLEGETPRLLAFEGELLYRLGDKDGAIASLDRATAAVDTLAMAENSLAWLLATWRDDPDGALPHAERALALEPGEPEIHDTYLEVLIRLGRTEEARTHLAAILPRFPDNSTLQERSRELARRP